MTNVPTADWLINYVPDIDMKWIEALKEWNTGKGTWCIPRKGTPEYDEVRRLMTAEPVSPPVEIKVIQKPVSQYELSKYRKAEEKKGKTSIYVQTAAERKVELFGRKGNFVTWPAKYQKIGYLTENSFVLDEKKTEISADKILPITDTVTEAEYKLIKSTPK